MDFDPRVPVSATTLDFVLAAQFAVAWAGEGGEQPRMGWWRTFMVHDDGGLALFADLTPSTHAWVVFQGAREAARRADAAMRATDHDPDRIFGLFRFGFEIDERLEDRLLEHKRGGTPPIAALPGLSELCAPGWNRSTFADWVLGHGVVPFAASPAGRRIAGAPPSDIESRVRKLVGALAPLSTSWVAPHWKVG